MKVLLAVALLAVSTIPSLAQTADVFVKGDSYQCWVDVKDIVHRRGSRVTEDEKRWIIQAGHFSTMGGDVVLAIQVVPDKNKKGEDGCRIYVGVQGGGELASAGQSLNARNGSNNFRIASLISAEVEGMKKAREKKAREKKANKP